MEHRLRELLDAGVDEVRRSPKDHGRLDLIVRRPATETRELLEEAAFDVVEGLVGDNWRTRGSSSTPDGSAHPERQITLMNARAADLFAGSRDRWPLAGDQFYVDLDLDYANIPPGTRLEFGSAIVEITEPLHTGCAKFSARFGAEARRFVNSPVGRELNLRGVNAKVVAGGAVRRGATIKKID